MTTVELPEITFLVDVDNTLIDNDRAKSLVEQGLQRLMGPESNREFWSLYETVRQARGVVDYPETLRLFQSSKPNRLKFPHVAELILASPGSEAVYPGALEALAHLNSLGPAVIVSDGDEVCQPAKIARTGLADAVQQRVLVLAHKEREIQTITDAYPARHYAVVDDKPFLLSAFKATLGERVTTVHVRQGHYANQRQPDGTPFQLDHSFATIRELANLTREQALGADH